MKNPDKKFIKRCIDLSESALKKGDNPFGSVITKKEKIIAEAKNKIKNNDVTQHAEIVAMRKAQKILKTNDLSDCVIYSNCEPCPMCSFMIRELKFKKVVFSLESPYMGGFSRWNILKDKKILKFRPIFSDPPEVVKGVLKNEAKKVFEKVGWMPDKGFLKKVGENKK